MMRRMFRFLFCVCAIHAAAASMPRDSHGQILINEYMPDPARDWDGDGQYSYRDDEWVEIINIGSQTVDLSGFLIRDGGDPSYWRYGFSGTIAPGQTRIAFGSDAVAWEESNGFPIYGLSLNNAGDELFLCRIVEAETLVVDAASFGRTAVDDRSIGRIVSDPSVWAMFDAWNPCSDSCSPSGTGCVPTPGKPNECTTSVAESSWGAIKLINRR